MYIAPTPDTIMNEKRWNGRLIILSRLVFLLSVILLVTSLGLYIAMTLKGFAGVDASVVVMIAGAALANGVVGLLILSRYPRHAVGWLLLLLSVVTTFAGASNLGLGLSENGLVAASNLITAVLLWMGNWVWFVWVVLLLIFIPLYFPDGQLLTRRWRIIAWAGVLSTFSMILALTIAPDILDSVGDPVDMGDSMFGLGAFLNSYVAGPLAAIGMVGAILSVILRYRRSGPLQRAQIKWVFFTILVGIGVITQMDSIAQLLPMARPFIELYSFQIFLLFPMALPIVIGVAIMRYRLYDIDIIIRRTLQYTVLSVLLALVYFGIVALLQGMFDSVSGQQPPIVIVISTLLIAALFNPLRQRVQTFIDRRFYRQKYDTQQILTQFAQTARDEVEIDALQTELLRVVQETLQPEVVGVWFKAGKKNEVAS